MSVRRCEITDSALDPADWWKAVQDPSCGATVLMTGQVRDHHQGNRVVSLEYQAYRAMAQEVLEEISGQADARWTGLRIAAGHSLGAMEVGTVSVVVAVSAPHRGEAFEACRHIIDTLKERLPVWKKEFGPDGQRWQEEVPLETREDGREEKGS